MEGWISLHRRIKKHWIWENNLYLKLWIDFLLRANYEDNKVLIESSLIDVERGSFIASQLKLAKENSVSRSKIRTFLNLLENDSMIEQKMTNKFTKITICNYDSYQIESPTEEQQKNIKKTSKRHQKDTENKENKENKENNIFVRKQKFKEELRNFGNTYPKEMLNDFYGYWTEQNKKGTKMRFELEKTWELKRRLEYWDRRSVGSFGNNGKGKEWTENDVIEYCKKNNIPFMASGGKITGTSTALTAIFTKNEDGTWKKK